MKSLPASNKSLLLVPPQWILPKQQWSLFQKRKFVSDIRYSVNSVVIVCVKVPRYNFLNFHFSLCVQMILWCSCAHEETHTTVNDILQVEAKMEGPSCTNPRLRPSSEAWPSDYSPLVVTNSPYQSSSRRKLELTSRHRHSLASSNTRRHRRHSDKSSSATNITSSNNTNASPCTTSSISSSPMCLRQSIVTGSEDSLSRLHNVCESDRQRPDASCSCSEPEKYQRLHQKQCHPSCEEQSPLYPCRLSNSLLEHIQSSFQFLRRNVPLKQILSSSSRPDKSSNVCSKSPSSLTERCQSSTSLSNSLQNNSTSSLTNYKSSCVPQSLQSTNSSAKIRKSASNKKSRSSLGFSIPSWTTVIPIMILLFAALPNFAGEYLFILTLI